MSPTPATSRSRITDITLTERLETTLTHDPVAQNALCAFLAVSFLLPFGASDPTFECAVSLEVLGPVAVMLLLGLILALDCRNWAQDQVAEAAQKFSGSLRVSRSLELSSDTMASAYHGWLKKIPAVRAHPWLVACIESAMQAQLALKEAESYSWVQHAAQSPSTLLLVSFVVASTMPGYFQLQSHLSSVAAMAAAASITSMMLLKNSCFPSIVNEPDFSLTAVAAGSVLHSAIGHLVFPVKMKHVPALAAILWANTVGATYIAYLNLIDSSGNLWAADPGRWVLLTVVVSATLTQLASVSTRYYIASLNMKAFFRHVNPKP